MYCLDEFVPYYRDYQRKYWALVGGLDGVIMWPSKRWYANADRVQYTNNHVLIISYLILSSS